MTLQNFFKQHPTVALAFSGGVDSAYLLWAARDAGADIQPYFLKTPFQPAFELEDARRLAPNLIVLEADGLQDPTVAANPPDRCYHCKKFLFGLLKQRSMADGHLPFYAGQHMAHSHRHAHRP